MWPGVTMEEQSSSSGEAPKPAPKSKALWIVVAVIVVVVVVLAAAALGALFAGGSLASIKTAGDNGVVMVSPSATSVKLSDLSVTGGWFFRTISSDRLQGSVAADYLYTNSSFKYAAALFINNPYGVGLASIFKTKFEAHGGKVNQSIPIPEK